MEGYGLFRYLKPYLSRYFLFFLFLSLSSILTIVSPLLVKIIIDNVMLGGDTSLLLTLIAIFSGAIIFSTAFRIISGYLQAYITEHFEFDLEKAMLTSILSSRLDLVQKENVGDILSRMDDDVEGASDLVFNIIGDLASTLLTITAILVVSFALDWRLTLIALFPVPILILVQRYYGEKIKTAFGEIRVLGAGLINFLQQRLRDIQLIQIFNNMVYESRLFESKFALFVRKNVDFEIIRSMRETFVDLLSLVSKVLVLGYGGYLVINGRTTVGVFVAMYAYTEMLLDPIQSLATIHSSIKKNQVSAERIKSMVDRLKAIPEGDVAIDGSKPVIEFKDVSFSHDPEKELLTNISIRLEGGNVYGLTGPSGCGKSSIGYLLSRLYDPLSGTITYNGADLKTLRLSELRDKVTIVTSEPTLYDETIMENIKYGKTEASEVEVMQVSIETGIFDFIMSLPDQYKTTLSSMEETLSEGQMQRLCIARALLRDTPVLVIDEAISGLDAKNQKMFLTLFQNLKKRGKLIIIISHQLEILEDMDGIIFINNGVVEESGKFRQLMAKKKMFHRFFTMQTGSAKKRAIRFEKGQTSGKKD